VPNCRDSAGAGGSLARMSNKKRSYDSAPDDAQRNPPEVEQADMCAHRATDRQLDQSGYFADLVGLVFGYHGLLVLRFYAGDAHRRKLWNSHALRDVTYRRYIAASAHSRRDGGY